MKTSSARTAAPSPMPANEPKGDARQAPPKPRVSIADRAGHAFPPHTIVHGFAHQTRGDVEIAEMSTVAVIAKIRGARTETVTLREKTGALLAGCTCPARSLGLDVCKHQWATLLEADRLGGLAGLRTNVTKLDVRPLDVATNTATNTATNVAPNAATNVAPNAATNVAPNAATDEAANDPSAVRRPKRARTTKIATEAKAGRREAAAANAKKTAPRRSEPGKPRKPEAAEGTRAGADAGASAGQPVTCDEW